MNAPVIEIKNICCLCFGRKGEGELWRTISHKTQQDSGHLSKRCNRDQTMQGWLREAGAYMHCNIRKMQHSFIAFTFRQWIRVRQTVKRWH